MISFSIFYLFGGGPHWFLHLRRKPMDATMTIHLHLSLDNLFQLDNIFGKVADTFG